MTGTIKSAAVNHVGGVRKIHLTIEVDFSRDFKAPDLGLDAVVGRTVSLPFDLEPKAKPEGEAKAS
jgi:hypothetical protein